MRRIIIVNLLPKYQGCHVGICSLFKGIHGRLMKQINKKGSTKIGNLNIKGTMLGE
jgi:hypothetical protein